MRGAPRQLRALLEGYARNVCSILVLIAFVVCFVLLFSSMRLRFPAALAPVRLDATADIPSPRPAHPHTPPGSGSGGGADTVPHPTGSGGDGGEPETPPIHPGSGGMVSPLSMFPHGHRMCSGEHDEVLVATAADAFAYRKGGYCRFDESDVEILFVHVGPDIGTGKHVFEAIQQARRSNPCVPITWVLSRTAFEAEARARATALCYDVKVVHTESFDGDGLLARLKDVFFVSGNMGVNGNPADFNLRTLSRMFMVRAYMAGVGRKRRVFHVENDNPVYVDVRTLDKAYKECGYRIASPIRSMQFFVLGFAYIADEAALTDMVQFYVDTMAKGVEKVRKQLGSEWINEMSLTASYAKMHPGRVHILPVTPDERFEKPNCGYERTRQLVDGASVAVYHLGDFHSRRPFANRNGWGAYATFDPRPYHLQWQYHGRDDLPCSQPLLVPKNGVAGGPLVLANLHVHHKMLYRVMAGCVRSRREGALQFHNTGAELFRRMDADLVVQEGLYIDVHTKREPANKDRRPSWPLVSGDGFRGACRHHCGAEGCNFQPEGLWRGACVAIDTTNIGTGNTTAEYVQKFLKEMLPRVQHPIVLVTHNGDLSMPDGDSHLPQEPKWPHLTFSGYLEHKMIAAWFASNCYWRGYETGAPKPRNLVCIPIGIENRYNSVGGRPRAYFEQMAQPRTIGEGKTLLVAFGAHRIKPDRAVVLKKLESAAWVTRGGGSRQEWVAQVQSHRFTLCPHGHGLDTHRTWEVLLLGGVPVVKSSSMDSMYDGLPVVILPSWDDLTPERLAKEWDRISSSTFHMDRMFWPYWGSLLRVAQEGAEAWVAQGGNPFLANPRKIFLPGAEGKVRQRATTPSGNSSTGSALAKTSELSQPKPPPCAGTAGGRFNSTGLLPEAYNCTLPRLTRTMKTRAIRSPRWVTPWP